MTNRSKDKGTKFETAVVRYLRVMLEDDRIERRALHGSHDMGDIHGLRCHGYEGIAECKDYKEWARADLDRWKAQTIAERDNADAGFALLVVHRRGCSAQATSHSFGENDCYLTIGDLMRISGMGEPESPWADAEWVWARITIADAAVLMQFGGERQ